MSEGYKERFEGIYFPAIAIKYPSIWLDYTHFSVRYSHALGHGVMGAVNMRVVQSIRLITADRPWRVDERAKGGKMMKAADYTRLRCDRGHIVDQCAPQHGGLYEIQQASSDTFHYTNCSPRLPDINRGVWRQIEQWVLKRSGAITMSVQTGVVTGEIIPSGYWKIATWIEKTKQKSVGFWVDQPQPGSRGLLALTKQMRIADIEAKAGVDIDLAIASCDVLGTKRSIDSLPALEGPDDLEL